MGLLGGAIATHFRAGSPAFEAYVFPILLGLLIWGAAGGGTSGCVPWFRCAVQTEIRLS